MRTSIRTKILVGFLLVILLMAGLALYSNAVSETALEVSVGKNSIFVAEEISKRIMHDIYARIGELQGHSIHGVFQETLQTSNREFEKQSDIDAWIGKHEREWVSSPRKEITPFMRGVIDNKLANGLREELIEFYERKHGNRCLNQIVVTNRYGAVVAETSKTLHYRQDDQEWWQMAIQDDFCLSDVSQGETGDDVYAVFVGIKVENRMGEFIGAIKAVLTIKGIVREAEIAAKRYETTKIKLLTRDGRLIYRTQAFKFMEDVSNRRFFKKITGEEGFFEVREKGRDELFSYARSNDYRGLNSLGWIVVVAHNTDEILAPVVKVRNKVLGAALGLLVLGVLITFFITRPIARSISSLMQGAMEFGRGNLEYRIEVKNRDEMGQLAGGFNRMAGARKAAEDENISARSRLKHLLTTSPAVIYTSKAEGDYGATFISENIRTQIGYEPIDFLNDPNFWAEHIHPEDQQRVFENLNHLLEHDAHIHEYRFLSKDGTYRWMHDEARLIRDKGGRALEVVGCWTDVTERRKAEEALRESEERLRNAFDFAAIGMIMADPDGRFVQVNRAMCEMMGYSAEELLKTDFQSITHPDDLDEDLDHHARLLKGEVPFYHTEKRFIHRQGHKVWAHLAVSLLRDMEGNPLHFTAQIQDITETRQARDKILRQSVLLDGINRVFRRVLTCETEYEVGSICLAVAEELTGSKFSFMGELNPEGLFDTVAIRDPGWEACKIPRSASTRMVKNMRVGGIYGYTLREGKSRIVNDPASHPDRAGTPEGHPQITSFLGVPMKSGEKTIGMIGLGNKEGGYDREDQETVESLCVAFAEALQDKRNKIELVKHRHYLEELVETRTAALERSNKELAQFAYVASHDLQEPLRKVQAFGDRLKAKYSELMDEQGRDYMERMQGATRRMRAMIDDLLSLSRIQTRAQPFVSVDLGDVARDAASDWEMRIEQTGGRVEIGDLPIIDADPSQLRQLFGNLISNALKFKQDGVTPVVKIYSKPVDREDETGSVGQCEIIVEDNGIGFDEKFAARIFNPFERLHGRSQYEGTGIGLSICKRIVERHGGNLIAQGEPDRGAKFIITLPVAQ